jgi:hypothetical protein
MSMIATHLKEHGLGKFKPQELSILAWSFSSTGGLACPQVICHDGISLLFLFASQI